MSNQEMGASRETHDVETTADDVARLARETAHDLNNLLTVIGCSAALAGQERDARAVAEHLGAIESSVDKARELTDRILARVPKV